MNDLPRWWPSPAWVWFWFRGGFSLAVEDGRPPIRAGFRAVKTALYHARGQKKWYQL